MFSLLQEARFFKKPVKKKKRERIRFDINGNIQQAAKHRSDFGRNIRKISYELDSESIHRYYYEANDGFLALMNEFNLRNSHSSFFTCAGYVNVKLRMCSKCFDVEKDRQSRDLYFIDHRALSMAPKVLCFGCLSFILNEFEKCLLYEVEEEEENGNQAEC